MATLTSLSQIKEQVMQQSKELKAATRTALKAAAMSAIAERGYTVRAQFADGTLEIQKEFLVERVRVMTSQFPSLGFAFDQHEVPSIGAGVEVVVAAVLGTAEKPLAAKHAVVHFIRVPAIRQALLALKLAKGTVKPGVVYWVSIEKLVGDEVPTTVPFTLAKSGVASEHPEVDVLRHYVATALGVPPERVQISVQF
jgi:hypothetical protein